MLSKEEKLSNNDRHRTDLLPSKYDAHNNLNLGTWKEFYLLLAGNVLTLSLIVLIVGLILSKVNEPDRTSITQLVSYSLMFGGLVAILGLDIKKYLRKFKNWIPYVVGLAFGISILIIDDLYIRLVNLFYTTDTGGNETAIRQIISNFPVASLIVFGFVGPMCEELTYRVGLFNLSKRWNRVFAYIITALVFGLIHMDFQGNIVTEFILLPSYIIPGILLSIAYELYDLPCSYTAHIFNNLFVIIQLIIRYNS